MNNLHLSPRHRIHTFFIAYFSHSILLDSWLSRSFFTRKTVCVKLVIFSYNTRVLTQRCRGWKHGFRRRENTECVVLHLPNVRQYLNMSYFTNVLT